MNNSVKIIFLDRSGTQNIEVDAHLTGRRPGYLLHDWVETNPRRGQVIQRKVERSRQLEVARRANLRLRTEQGFFALTNANDERLTPYRECAEASVPENTIFPCSGRRSAREEVDLSSQVKAVTDALLWDGWQSKFKKHEVVWVATGIFYALKGQDLSCDEKGRVSFSQVLGLNEEWAAAHPKKALQRQAQAVADSIFWPQYFGKEVGADVEGDHVRAWGGMRLVFKENYKKAVLSIRRALEVGRIQFVDPSSPSMQPEGLSEHKI